MATIIQIAHEEPKEAVERVRALLEEVAHRDPNWSGAVFEVGRDDFTCIPGDDSIETVALYGRIQSALIGE